MKKIICVLIIFIIIIFGGVIFFINKNSEISLKEDEYILKIGEEKEILFSTKKKYKYTSDDSNIVSVNADGVLIAKSEGETTVKIKRGWKTKKCKVMVLSVVESIEFENDNYNIKKGEEFVIPYNTYPESADVESESWSSSDEKIVSVEKGKIKALSCGTSTITLIINDKIEKSVLVTVYQEVEEIVLNKSEISLEVGNSFIVNAEVKPLDATDKQLIWKSSDESIAKVTNGKIEALKPGVVIISAESSNKKISQLKVNISDIKAQSVSLNKNKVTTYVGYNFKLNATVKPDKVKDKSVVWTSSNNSVATVKDGYVVPKQVGSTTITAKTSNGKYVTCKIMVINKTYGKNAIFFGDSITQGVLGTPKNYSWANYIGDHYDLKSATNAGKSGWYISNWKNATWIVTNVKKYKGKNYDYVILHGGINDIHSDVTLGTYNSKDFSGKYNEKTFLGGLETYIYTVKKQWPNARIGYIINYYTPLVYTKSNDKYANYYSEMKNVLKKWNIKYIDLFSGSTPNGIKYSELLKVNTKKYIGDGLHLNSEGYKLISPYIYNWMNTL